MKLSMRTVLVPALLALVLAGCSSNDEEELILPEIDNKVEPDYVWSSSVGDGIEHYDSNIVMKSLHWLLIKRLRPVLKPAKTRYWMSN